MSDNPQGGSPSRRWLVPALAVVIATALVFSAFGGSWWIGLEEGGKHALALGHATLCLGAACRTRGFAELGIDETWGKSAFGLQITLLVIAALVVAVAVTRPKVVGRRLAWVAMVMVLFAATLAVIVHSLVPFDGVSPGTSLFVAFGGLSGTIALCGFRLFAPPVDS